MLYFELLNRATGKLTPKMLPAGIYASDEYLADHDMPPGIIAWTANRIWREQNGKVDYVKFKGGNPQEQEVDMKEFMFIKLTAELI